jgi:hypothetical protein
MFKEKRGGHATVLNEKVNLIGKLNKLWKLFANQKKIYDSMI